MKHLRYAYSALIFVILLITFTGCSDQKSTGNAENAMWDLTGAKPIYVSEWPENDYTAKISAPQHGEINYIYDFSDEGRYAVFLKNISKEESEKYVNALKLDGFTEQFAEGNTVSVGTMLRKDDVILSVAYSDGSFGMIIMIDSENGE